MSIKSFFKYCTYILECPKIYAPTKKKGTHVVTIGKCVSVMCSWPIIFTLGRWHDCNL